MRAISNVGETALSRISLPGASFTSAWDCAIYVMDVGVRLMRSVSIQYVICTPQLCSVRSVVNQGSIITLRVEPLCGAVFLSVISICAKDPQQHCILEKCTHMHPLGCQGHEDVIKICTWLLFSHIICDYPAQLCSLVCACHHRQGYDVWLKTSASD